MIMYEMRTVCNDVVVMKKVDSAVRPVSKRTEVVRIVCCPVLGQSRASIFSSKYLAKFDNSDRGW
jgi:hypothetical protein